MNKSMSLAHGAGILSEGDTVIHKQLPPPFMLVCHVSGDSKAKKEIIIE